MKRITPLLISFPFLANAEIIELSPHSYSFDQETGVGAFEYNDEKGNQLVDGKRGSDQFWYDNLGNGPAYEWVGWLHKPVVNIDFSFGQLFHFDSVTIGSIQDHSDDVVIPNIELLISSDGVSWSSIASVINPETEQNNYARQDITITNLNTYQTSLVRVSLKHALDGPWTFVDEIDFFVDDAIRANHESLMINAQVPAAPAGGLILLSMLGFTRIFRKK